MEKNYSFIDFAPGLWKSLLLPIVISGLIGNVIIFHSYRSENMTKVITRNEVTF
jgi:hypothetical protein